MLRRREEKEGEMPFTHTKSPGRVLRDSILFGWLAHMTFAI